MSRYFKRECDFCGKFYEGQGKQFCSNHCRITYQCLVRPILLPGENNPNYKGGKSRAICETCGKTFDYYPCKTAGKFCSKDCERLSPRMAKIRSNNGNKTRLIFQKLPDDKLLELWESVKIGKIRTLSQAFRPYGYCRIPPKRLRKLVGRENYKEETRKLEERYKVDRVNYMGSRIHRRGYLAELEALKRAEAMGYYMFRSGGSRGAADLIALKPKEILLIQVKSAIREVNVPVYYKHDIERLRQFVDVGTKELWIKVMRKGWQRWLITETDILKVE